MYRTKESPFEVVEKSLNNFFCGEISQDKLLSIVEKQYLRAKRWLRELNKVGESGFPTLKSFVGRFESGNRQLLNALHRVQVALFHDDLEALNGARLSLQQGHATLVGLQAA